MAPPTIARIPSFSSYPAAVPENAARPAAADSSGRTSSTDTTPAHVRARNAGGTMRRLSMSAQAAAQTTGTKVEAEIAGTTHAVGIAGSGSILHGMEKDLLGDGDKVAIDIDHPIFSRRGPNQELMGNSKQDAATSEPGHAWYPKYDENASNYQTEGWPHYRADAFPALAGVLRTSLNDALPANLRARAAPVSEYTKMSACESAGDFIAEQKAYQAKLSAHFPKDSILASHRSVGFEYEFTGHSQKQADSHISLASSAEHSALFGIKFELETDSGAVVEIGMPPFIVPNKPDGSPDKKELLAIHVKMRTAMEQVRDTAITMAENGPVKLAAFIQILEEKGLGSEWAVSTETKHKDMIDKLEIRKPTAEKLKDGKIYSQMNISLNGDESGKLIASARKHFASKLNFAEESALGTTYDALDNLTRQHLAAQTGSTPAEIEPPPHFVHLNKALANTLAIPSILLQKELQEGGKHDLSSAVKELFSVWPKDSLPNILAMTSASGADLMALKTFAGERARPVVLTQLTQLRAQLQDLSLPCDAQSTLWGQVARSFNEHTFDVGSLEILTNATRQITNATMLQPIMDLAAKLDKSMDKHGEFVNADAGENYPSDNAAFNQMIQAAARNSTKSAILDRVFATAEQELDNTIRQIGTDAVVGVPHGVSFQNETFGVEGGVGVRKDTQIAHDKTNPADLRQLVVEVRNEAAMKHLLESKS